MSSRAISSGRFIDQVDDGVYVLSGARTIIYWNKGAERITGCPSAEVIGRPCYDNMLIHVDDMANPLCTGVGLHYRLGDGEPSPVPSPPLRRLRGFFRAERAQTFPCRPCRSGTPRAAPYERTGSHRPCSARPLFRPRPKPADWRVRLRSRPSRDASRVSIPLSLPPQGHARRHTALSSRFRTRRGPGHGNRRGR